MKLAIIGAGGLGANLAILASEQGHKVLLIDNDTSDKKFFGRFMFYSGRTGLVMGMPKINIVQQVAMARNHNIAAIYATVDEHFNYEILKGYFCIIAVDTGRAREIIEAKLKAEGLEFVHVGCNLNSVSIYPSMTGMIYNDPDPDAPTSYDSVPDALTYAVTAAELLQWLDHKRIRVNILDAVFKLDDAPEVTGIPALFEEVNT